MPSLIALRANENDALITALVYSDGAWFEEFLKLHVAALADDGMQLAGFVQHSMKKPGRTACDMHLEDLATGEIYRISEDRGPEARGCTLSTDKLLRACMASKIRHQRSASS